MNEPCSLFTSCWERVHTLACCRRGGHGRPDRILDGAGAEIVEHVDGTEGHQRPRNTVRHGEQENGIHHGYAHRRYGFCDVASCLMCVCLYVCVWYRCKKNRSNEYINEFILTSQCCVLWERCFINATHTQESEAEDRYKLAVYLFYSFWESLLSCFRFRAHFFLVFDLTWYFFGCFRFPKLITSTTSHSAECLVFGFVFFLLGVGNLLEWSSLKRTARVADLKQALNRIAFAQCGIPWKNKTARELTTGDNHARLLSLCLIP